MEPEFRWLNKELYTRKGEIIFEDTHEHYKWMMNNYIVHEPEILGRLQYTATHSELTYEGTKDTAGEGSGPEQMCQAASTCKVKFNEDPFTSQVRNGNAEHYVRLFVYTDPATGEPRSPPIQLAIDVLAAVDSPNPEFEQLKKEYEAIYCGSAFSKKKDGGAIDWIRQAEDRTNWDPAMDAIPSNLGFEAGDSSVPLEQLATAGFLAAAAMKLKAVANIVVAEAVPWLSRHPSQPGKSQSFSKIMIN